MEAGLRLVDTGRPGALDGSSEALPPPAPPGDDTPSNEGATFTLKGAAERCLVDPQTVRRRLKQLEQRGDLHGARRNDDGSWFIPLKALIAAGLQPGKPSPPDTHPDQPAVIPGHASPPHPDNSELIAELGRAIHRAELAEQAAAERDRTIRILQGNVEDLRRQLEPGKSSTAPAPPAPSPTPEPFASASPTPTVVEADAEPAIVQPAPPATAPKWPRLRRLFGQ